MTRLVLFSDGTGNSSAKAQKTNVWRMFQALDQTNQDQLAKYDDGVGTSSNKYLAALGGAFGFGLKRNVIDLYKFTCRNYKSGDEIFGFGFSRGAFTIRVLVGLISTQGLVTGRSESELHSNALTAYRRYRIKRFPSKSPFVWAARKIRDLILLPKTREAAKVPPGPYEGKDRIPIKFLGLWDTVGAYGMPIEELKWGFNLLVWPMVAVDTHLFPKVGRACHALALDEQRETFSPILFDEVEEARRVAENPKLAGRLTQVWFAGVHSNIGGGYPEDRASLVSLDWMMSQATHEGLVLKTGAVDEVTDARSAFARLYDSRAGLAAYYRYSPRDVQALVDPKHRKIRPIIHGSAVMRMARGSDSYAPISWPQSFNVLAPDGSLLQMTGFAADAAAHVARPRSTSSSDTGAVATRTAALQAAIASMGKPEPEMVNQVRDTVWWRRVTYFVCAFFTVCLVLFPWAADLYTTVFKGLGRQIPFIGEDLVSSATSSVNFWNDFGHGGVKTIVETFSSALPSYLGKWLTAAQDRPFEMLLAISLVAIPFSLGDFLAMRIHDRAWFAWHPDKRKDYLDWVVQSARNSRTRAAVISGALAAGWAMAWASSSSPKARAVWAVFAVTSMLVLLWRVWISRRLASIQDAVVAGKTALPSTPTLSIARWLRQSIALKAVYWWMAERIVPILVVFVFAIGVLAVLHHLVYQGASAAGVFCQSNAPAKAVEVVASSTADGFKTSEPCWRSGLKLKSGVTYEVELQSNGDWFDQVLRTDVAGFRFGGLKHLLASPLKRTWSANWFQPIVRVGATGDDEYPMHVEPPPEGPGVDYRRYEEYDRGAFVPIHPAAVTSILQREPKPEAPRNATVRLTATRDEELYVYVNDALTMVPFSKHGIFYENNTGTAKLVVRVVSPDTKS